MRYEVIYRPIIPTFHHGWEIWRDDSQPVTGRWRAERYGVGMCAGTQGALLNMIEQRTRDAQEAARKRREAELCG